MPKRRESIRSLGWTVVPTVVVPLMVRGAAGAAVASMRDLDDALIALDDDLGDPDGQLVGAAA